MESECKVVKKTLYLLIRILNTNILLLKQAYSKNSLKGSIWHIFFMKYCSLFSRLQHGSLGDEESFETIFNRLVIKCNSVLICRRCSRVVLLTVKNFSIRSIFTVETILNWTDFDIIRVLFQKSNDFFQKKLRSKSVFY